MIVMFMLEILAGGVGVVNLAKNLYSFYGDANKIREAKQEYEYYVELQKNPPKQLTESQYDIYEEGFLIL